MRGWLFVLSVALMAVLAAFGLYWDLSFLQVMTLGALSGTSGILFAWACD